MEDINALYKALEQADAAGDKESAQELANYIRTLPTQEPTIEQPIVDVTQTPTIKPPVTKPITPIDVMGQQFTPEEYAKYSGMPIAAKPGEQAKGEFSGSFGRSIYNLAADLALAHGRSIGNIEEAEATAKRLREYGANTYTNTTKGWKEDPIAKIQELAGGSAPYMLAPITAALGSTALGATGLAAAAAPMVASTLQFIGSNLQRQMDQNKKLADTNLLKAGALAIPAAVLDQIGFRFIPGIKRLFGAAGKEITDEAANALVKKSMLSRAGEKVLATGEGMAVEGVTEAAQQLLERLQAGLSITDAEARKEYFDSFIGGVALAGAFGVSGQVIEGVASKIGQDKQVEKEKEIETEPPVAEEMRPSRDVLKKATLKDLEEKANEINRVKEEAAAQLKAAQTQQVVTEAADLESMAPVNPTEITDTTLTSWGLSKNSKPYKTLIGQDAGTPEGRALIDTALESYMGKINEPAVETYKNLLDQQKLEATDAGLDLGTTTISDAVSGGSKYGTPGGTQGRFGPTTDISGSPVRVVETGKEAGNAPLETIAPVVEAPVVEAPVVEAPVSTQPKLASQLRALDSTNPLIEALQFDQASEEEVAVAQNTIKELQASRKAKRADLTKVSEEEKDLPQEARGEIQNTGETPDTIEGAFQKQYGKNVRLAKQRGLLNFLNDVSELPAEVGLVTPGTKAVYHKGKGYFITNRITREDAPRMLLHEIGVHYGLEGMLGTNNYKRVVKQIKQKHLTDKELKASWDNTLQTYPELTEGSDNFMQEVIANIGETAPNNSIWRQITGYIRQFLSKLGYGWNVNNITADDIRDMVQHSVRMSLAGKVKGMQPGITMKGEKDTGAPKPTYYSQLVRTITNAVFPKGMTFQPADQWLAWLNSKASEGIKKDELEFSGIADYLKMRGKDKIDKQELINYLADNGPQVEEIKLGVNEEGNVSDDEAKAAWVEDNLLDWIDSEYGNDYESTLQQTASEQAVDNYDFPYYVKEENVTDANGNKGYRIYMEQYTSGPILDTYYFSEDEAQQIADEENNNGIQSYADDIYKELRRDFDRAVENRREELEFEFDDFTGPLAPKYGHVTLKGGEINYAEVILSLKNPLESRKLKDISVVEGRDGWSVIDKDTGILFDQDENGNPIVYNSEAAAYNRAIEVKDGSYRVPKDQPVKFAHFHWEGVNNPVAHYRVNQRMDKTGARVLFVEEIQSDWAQSPKTLRKRYIRKLAKQYGIKPRQMADFVPGDWGFKKPPTPEIQNKIAVLGKKLEELRAQRKLARENLKESYRLKNKAHDSINKTVLQMGGVGGYETSFILNPDIYAREKDNIDPGAKLIIVNLINNPEIKELRKTYSYFDARETIFDREESDLYQEISDIQGELIDLPSSGSDKIERGPWVTDTEAWSNLILKNIVRFAVDQGYEKVAFVNGKQAAYKGGRLEEFEEIFATRNNDDTYNIHATLKDEGGRTRDIPNVRDEELEEYVGSIADNIRDLQPGETDGWDADKIKIASQGMTEFYDTYIPRYMGKLLKKLGGGNLETISFEAPNAYAPPEQRVGDQVGFTITKEMADKALKGQPLFARASKQQLDEDLNKSGTKAKEKAPEPTTWDRFKEAPIKTIDEMIADFRKNFFSFDAAINNKILISMRQQGISEKEVAKSFYEMRVSQAVKADQLADMWMVHGDISYDPNSLSFVISDVKDSMSTIRNQLKTLATKYGVSEYEMYQYGNAAFVAQRSQGLNESNKVLKKKVLKLLVQGKKTQANTAMERGFKLVHLTPAEIRHGLNFFKTIPELSKVYRIWNKNRRRLLAFAEQNGLYDSEEAQDLLDVIDYVPFFRDKQIEAGKGPKTYTRGLLDAAVDKRLKGSYQPVNNVFDNMERWAKYILKKSINNKAAQEKIKFYSKYIPDDIKILRGKERKDTGNIVNIWQNGNLVKYEFQGYDGDSMVDGFTGLEPINGLVVPQFLNKYAAFQRAQIVLEPLFNFAQITMDAFDALISSGVNYPVLLPLQVVKEVVLMPFGASKARAYLKQRGIVGKYDWASEYDNIDIQGMKQLKELKTSDKMIKAILSPATVSIKGLKFLGMLSDNLIRQAVWSQIMLETKDAARATFVADEIINFRRTGSNAYVSAARQMAPFVNANLQSANIAFGTMLLSGITPDTKLTQFRRLITSGAQVTAAVLLLTALNADDDDYKKLDPKDRDRLLIIPGSGGYALPVRGSIIAAIYKITPEHLYNRYIEESEDSEKLKKGLTEAFKRAIALPTGFPTLLTPILELSLNLDTVTGLPLRGQSQKDLEADLQYSNKYTSQLARWANDATGVSPIVVQNFMNRWLASTSMLISMFTNKLIADIRGEILPEKTFKEKFLQLPSANKFVTKQQNTRNINDYYELNEIVTAIVNSANKYKDIDYDKFAEYQAKDNNAAIIDMRSELATISRDLTNLRNWENKIYSSKDTGQWTPQTKKQELDRIEQLRQDILGHQQAVEDRLERRIQNLRRQAGL
jgi:hypothetical protein